MQVAARDLRVGDVIRGIREVSAIEYNWGVVYVSFAGQAGRVPYNHGDPVDIDRPSATEPVVHLTLSGEDVRRIFQALCAEAARLEGLYSLSHPTVEHACDLRDLFARNHPETQEV